MIPLGKGAGVISARRLLGACGAALLLAWASLACGDYQQIVSRGKFCNKLQAPGTSTALILRLGKDPVTTMVAAPGKCSACLDIPSGIDVPVDLQWDGQSQSLLSGIVEIDLGWQFVLSAEMSSSGSSFAPIMVPVGQLCETAQVF